MDWTICDILGHARQYRESQRMALTRRGYWQMRPCVRVTCRRCGCGGPAAYEPGARERLADWWRALANEIRESYDPPPTRPWDDCPF